MYSLCETLKIVTNISLLLVFDNISNSVEYIRSVNVISYNMNNIQCTVLIKIFQYFHSFNFYLLIFNKYILSCRWSSRSCLERKHFLCHTKLKIISNKDKKKLQRQYNAGKDNKLNEIPVPILMGGVNTTFLKDYSSNVISNKIQSPARIPNAGHRKKSRNKESGKRSKSSLKKQIDGGTVIYEIPRVKEGGFRKRRNKSKDGKRMDTSIKNIKWKTYYNQATMNPLYPRGIIEEFVYAKNH